LHEVDGLNLDLKSALSGLLRRLHEIEEIPLNRSVFRKIQLHRNNSFYDFLLKICEIVIKNLLPTEEKGHSKFRDFVRDERQMGVLFEEFVRNFYKLEQEHFDVQREDIHWAIISGDRDFLPKMQTDISLRSSERKIIIDTKYYRDALTEHYEKERIRSENMYQIFAYLKNLDQTDGMNKTCAGILLYPTVTKELDIKVTTHGHDVSFKTINLNQDWQGVHQDLLALIGINK
jgi:5-methylcytosine-specific restriction enzyme subunit McrC